MWRSHLRLALRSLRRDRGYALLNGVGLAVAIGACVLIALFVRDELSYDRHHERAGRIVAFGKEDAGSPFDDGPSLSTPYALGGALEDDVAGVEAAVRMTYGGEGGVFLLGDGPDDRHEVGGFFTDPTIFEVFTVPAVAGDTRTALADPGGAVVTAPTAERVFGSVAGAVGQSRRVVSMGDTLTFTVRAVVEAPPETSSLRYDVLLPMQALHEATTVSRDWGGSMYRTFALLRPGTDPAAVSAAADRLARAARDGDDGLRFVAVPLPAFHLSVLSQKEGFSGSPTYLRLFSAVAALILLLSAINYVNLATARGARRAQEVGVRKALGAGRAGLVAQFLTESVVLTGIAGGAGVALAALALPVFNDTFGKALTLGSLDGPFWVVLAIAVVAIGVAAGLYPALYLSRVRPARALGGGRALTGGAGGTWVRRGLVAVQFAAAVALLAMTATVARQLDYVRTTPLGFEPEGLVVVYVEDPALAAQTEALKAAFAASPAVTAAAGAGGVPPGFWYSFGDRPDPAQQDRDPMTFKVVDADPDYASALGFEMAAGTWFDRDRPSTLSGVVVNEAFADALDYAHGEVVGRTLNVGNWGEAEVVGVVRDFHHASLRESVEPVALAPNRPAPWDEADAPVRYSEVVVRLAPGREAEGMADLEAAWAEFSPDVPITTRRVADDIADLHAADADLARVFAFFALVAVVLAVFGLVGLASYAAARRTKEVGVRRVLGATVGGVVALLSREYVALAAVGVAVATPVAVLAAGRWLEGFAYHAPVSPWLFAAVAAVAVLVALASVAGQAVRAATADPTAALRSE